MMKIKIVAVVIIAALTQGCIEAKPKVKTWTPMECSRVDSGEYKIKFTKQSSILSASPSGISIMNEIDGRVVNLTKESESDWACLQVGTEQEWVE